MIQKGTVCVWAVDSRGSLNPIRQYKRKGEICTLIFCLMPLRAVHEFHAKGAVAPANDAVLPPTHTYIHTYIHLIHLHIQNS